MCSLSTAITGFLAYPTDSFPALFPQGTALHALFAAHPFLLPFLCAAAFTLSGMLLGFAYLPETIQSPEAGPHACMAHAATKSGQLWAGGTVGQIGRFAIVMSSVCL